MASNELPSEERLTEEIQRLCAKIGYRAGTQGIEAMKDVPALIGLEIVGGPAKPNDILELGKRREAVRQMLREIAEQEVAEELDKRYVDAAIKIFRLDAKHALGVQAHMALGKIQAPLDEVFGSPPGAKAFQDDHRPLIFAVMARALLARERQAREPAEDDRKGSRLPAHKASKAKIKADRKPNGKKAVSRNTVPSPRREAGSGGKSRPLPPKIQQKTASATPAPSRVHNPRKMSPRRRAVMKKREAEMRERRVQTKEARAWLKWPVLVLVILGIVFAIFLATGVIPT